MSDRRPRRRPLLLLSIVTLTLVAGAVGVLPFHGSAGRAPSAGTAASARALSRGVGPNSTYIPIPGVARSARMPVVSGDGIPGTFGPHPSVIGDGGSLVDRIAVGGDPYPGVYDNLTGELYVSNVDTDNVSVIQTSNDTVVATIPVGSLPQPGCLDPTDGDVYVSNFFSGNVSVISTATNRLVTSINLTLGYEPTTCTYDPVTDQVYVPNPNYGSNYPYLTAIYGSNHTVKTNIALGYGTGIDPITPTIDPANGLLYVSMSSGYYSTNWVVIVNASSDTTPSTLGVGYYPTQPTYDPVNGRLYVANNGGQTVSIINGTNDQLLPSTTVGYGPNTPAVDPTTGDVFVPVYESGANGNVTVLNATTNNVTAVVAVGDNPQTPLFDPEDGDLYVADEADTNLTVVSPTTDAIVRNYTIGSATLEPSLDDLGNLYASYEVSAYSSGAVAVIASTGLHASLSASPPLIAEHNPLSLTTATVGGSGLLSFNYTDLPVGCGSQDLPALNCTPSQAGTYAVEVSVSDAVGHEANATLNVTVRTAYPVTITESGLPSGTTWFFNASGLPAVTQSGPNATVYVPNGTFSYDLATGNKDFAPVPAATPLTINGGPATLWANFSLVTYPVTFTASGLPSGTVWYVNVSGEPSQGATAAQASVALDNGTHGFTVESSDSRYSPTPGVGAVTVHGGPQTVNVTFRYLVFPFVVDERGLPVGGIWYFNISGGHSTETSVEQISQTLANGSYTYTVATSDKTYAPTPATGTFTVLGAHPPINVTFAPVLFPVSFTESGLAGGTTWVVHLGTTVLSGAGAALNTTEVNGSYAYTVGPLPGWSASRYAGTVTVDGSAPTAVAITWTEVVYAVTFAATGLATGTTWSVTVQGTAHTTSQPSLTLDLVNGTYAYTYAGVGGYTLTNGTGAVNVAGAPTSAAALYAAQSSIAGSDLLLYVVLGVVAAAVVVGVIVALRRRPGPPAPAYAEPDTEPVPGDPAPEPAAP